MEPIVNFIEYDYSEYDKIIRDLSRRYPVLSVKTVGKSVFGRSIKALTLGESDSTVLYTAAFHGNERITATVLLKFIEELCEAVTNGRRLSDVDIKRALLGKSVTFIPLVNPDGCEISLKGATGCGEKADWVKRLSCGRYENWKANLRGVDINHNFDAGWNALRETEQKNGIFGPAPAFFGGKRPHSEPETAALVDFCRSHTVRYVLSLHTQGEVIYWDYNNIPTHRGRRMAEIFAASSGYALDVPNALSLGGGFKDWFIETFHRPGFTVELGKGKNPLPAESGAEIYERIKEMLTVGLLM
ncbi:MAG: gamma-D-glutamyl-meso-diaminopimelate peptidase [Ruminococcaceae bacterium]|nr:gamma-D-glutamyl-meso-diaminopimelate peptidase [Oscillospiraceae bacterium]